MNAILSSLQHPSDYSRLSTDESSNDDESSLQEEFISIRLEEESDSADEYEGDSAHEQQKVEFSLTSSSKKPLHCHQQIRIKVGYDSDNSDDDYDIEANILLQQQQRQRNRQQRQQRQEKEETWRWIRRYIRKCDPPLIYTCPLTLQIMYDPVKDCCGHNFERDAICDWLDVHGSCPITKKPMDISELLPAADLQNRIERWRMDHPRCNDDVLLLMDTKDSELVYLERMLLPQEKKVVEIIKTSTMKRRNKVEQTKRMKWISYVCSFLLIFATIVSLKSLLLGR